LWKKLKPEYNLKKSGQYREQKYRLKYSGNAIRIT